MVKPFKYDVGVFINDFDPLDLSNLNMVYKAASDCGELFIILKYNKQNDLVDYKIRYQWIFKLTSYFDNINIIPLEFNKDNKDNLNCYYFYHYIEDNFNKNVNAIYLEDDLYIKFDIKSQGFDIEEVKDLHFDVLRYTTGMSISPEDIHYYPFKYWDYIPNIVKEYYVKKVLIIGNESTGKSVLTQTLANIYNTNYVLEYSRDVCSRCGGEDYMVTEDFEEVLYQHKLNIKNGLKNANKLLFIDTDSFMTYYYRKHAGLMGNDENESILDFEKDISLISGEYGLVLFMESDVPYVQDDLRILERNEDGLRESCSEIIKEIYRKNGVKFRVITGSYSERLEKAKNIIRNEFGI